MPTPKLAVLALLALLALAQTTMAQDDDDMMDMDDEEMRMRMMSSDEMMDEVEEMEDRQDGDWSFRADASTPGGRQPLSIVAEAAFKDGAFKDATTTGAPCVPVAKCHGHADCGAKGKCLGINVGTCDCMACMSGSFCNLGSIVGQAPCGGLQNACNSSSNICNCEQGYQQAGGFKNFGDALVKFCGKQSCDGKTDNCFGLPCKSGMCACG